MSKFTKQMHSQNITQNEEHSSQIKTWKSIPSNKTNKKYSLQKLVTGFDKVKQYGEK